MKSISITVLATALITIAISRGEDFKTADGVVHSGKLLKVEADGIKITTDNGIEKLFFSQLPADVRAKYGYDPARAAAAASIREEQRRAQNAAVEMASNVTKQRASDAERARQQHLNELARAQVIQSITADSDMQAQLAESSDTMLQLVLQHRVAVGMNQVEALASWGAPTSINRTTNEAGVSQQWVYPKGRYDANYLYFDNGRLTSIQD